MDTFMINVRILIDVPIAIQAASLSSAIEESKELDIEDFVDLVGDRWDNSFKIIGINENWKEIKL